MTPSLLDQLLNVAVESSASDLILHLGKVPLVRVGGDLTAVQSPPLSDEDLDALWVRCGAPKDVLDFDASISIPDGTRFRVNLLHQLGARAAVLRRIRSDIPEMESLGVPCELLRDWSSRHSGIIIVSGPTGSGKSTTVASALEWINRSLPRHVVTIEDPIEYVFHSKVSLFTQREVGIDTSSFAEGLRHSLRQNPDVIFLGEIRDSVSAITAIQAAETGHLVFATLHASACAEVVDRLQLLFPPTEREAVRKTLATQLLGVLCQRLIPSVTGSVALLSEYFANFGFSRKIITEGRMADLQDFIKRGDPKQSRAFSDSLLQLVRDGRVSEDTAVEVSENPQEFLRLLKGVSSASQATRR